MKTDWSHLESMRTRRGHFSSETGDRFGAFFYQHGKASLKIIASEGTEEIPWEHVSVSVLDYKGERCATWDEMCVVKNLFWGEEETVLQFHPPKSEYVNCHPHCLHLWKKLGVESDLPPSIAVGPK